MADKWSRRKGKNTMAHWRKSYDFSLSFDENELDSSDESENDENVEAMKLYHRRKSTAIAVRARVSISLPKIFMCWFANKSSLVTNCYIFIMITGFAYVFFV